MTTPSPTGRRAAAESRTAEAAAAGADEVSLDPRTPAEWATLRGLGHRMVDDMLDYLASVRERPAWRPVPDDVKARLRSGVPWSGEGAQAAYEAFTRDVLPYPVGNVHPRFWGWVSGTGTPLAMLAEMLAAGMNNMSAASESAPAHVEAEVLDWCKTIFGFPSEASGLLVSGASEANLLALAAARNARAAAPDSGADVHTSGVRALAADPVLYCSDQTHASIDKAAALLGLGTAAVRKVATDAEFRIRVDELEAAIRRDVAEGRRPFAIVGTAGTVTTGATDDLAALADVAARHGLWLHVDGAFGAWAALVPELQDRLAGLERADSLAFDFHKWMYQPYEAGVVLVRDRAAHHAAVNPSSGGAGRAAYLTGLARGTSATAHPYNEYGIQLSRGFRALKLWLSLKADGVDRYATLIRQNVAQAAHLAELVAAHPALELLAPVPLNVVCLRYRGAAGAVRDAYLDDVNQEVLMRLQERGIAVPTGARVRGTFAIRCAITNHRTRRADLRELVDAVVALGDEVTAASP